MRASHHFKSISFLFSKCYGDGLGTSRLRPDSKARGKAKGFRPRPEGESQGRGGDQEESKKQLETWGAELDGDHAKLRATQAELAQLKETSSKCRADALMEISQLQARVDDAERKLAKVPEEITAARTAALAEYQPLAEFEHVWNENFDEGIRTFIYNVWREHSEWDLSFLGQAAKEMVTEFNAPPKTALADPHAEFMPPADQSPEVADQSP